MDIWTLYESYATPESRRSLTDEQRQLLAVCDLRQEVNAGGFDSYLRSGAADTASDALAVLPRVLGEDTRQVLVEALNLFGTANARTSDERAEVLDGDPEADDVLGGLDDRFYELEASQDADAVLGHFADGLGPWPGTVVKPKRRFWGRQAT